MDNRKEQTDTEQNRNITGPHSVPYPAEVLGTRSNDYMPEFPTSLPTQQETDVNYQDVALTWQESGILHAKYFLPRREKKCFQLYHIL